MKTGVNRKQSIEKRRRRIKRATETHERQWQQITNDQIYNTGNLQRQRDRESDREIYKKKIEQSEIDAVMMR